MPQNSENTMWEPEQPLRSSYTHLMMTLITTPSTTTTTLAPPPPDWVRSVEATFMMQNGDEKYTKILPDVDHYKYAHSTMKFNIAGVEILDYARAAASAIAVNASKQGGTIENEFIDTRNDNNDHRLIPLSNYHNNDSVSNANTIFVGVSEEMPNVNDGYRIRQTKVITTIEKNKYAGKCGSACSYSGDFIKLYRSYNEKNDITNHFYTTDRLEHHLMASQGYTMKPYIGHLGRNHIDPLCSCLKPLYRLYSGFMKDHLLTSTEQEKDMAEQILGYKFERILGFCTKEPGCGAYIPLYRFYNPILKDHLYTSDQQEVHYYKTHPEQAYGFESIECYVWQHNSSTKSCPTMMLANSMSKSAEEFARV